jgi:hypothetical protein
MVCPEGRLRAWPVAPCTWERGGTSVLRDPDLTMEDCFHIPQIFLTALPSRRTCDGFLRGYRAAYTAGGRSGWIGAGFEEA